MKKNDTYNLVLAALFLVMGFVLPTIFHNFGMGGPVFLPMHIPVLLCGLICSWRLGAVLGIILPILSAVLTGMPPLFPMGVIMAFELCAYGLVSGLVYHKMGKNVYIALPVAMIAGRVVSAVANVVILGFAGKPFALAGFLTSAFVTALPGILIQLVVIPVIIIALKKAKLIRV